MENKRKVLDHGFVNLVDSMGNDLKSANGARISFNKSKKELDKSDESLLYYLGKHNHASPFRSNVVTLHFKAPLFIARQAWKHIVGSDISFKDTQWNEVSGRYTQTAMEFYFPDKWRKQSSDNKQGSSGSVDGKGIDQMYHYGMATAMNTYNDLIRAGVGKEQARMVLPQSIYTEWWWTASLQAVAHFYKLRSDGHAQEEIRQYAQAVKELVEPLYPLSWEALTYTKE